MQPQRFRTARTRLLNEYELGPKIASLARLTIDVLLTGITVHVILTTPYGVLKYGLAMALITYYIEWLVILLKAPYEVLKNK